MSHINHRRGESRRLASKSHGGRFNCSGAWNRRANRRLRHATSQALMDLRSSGYEVEICEDHLFPLAREADDLWNYD